MQMAAIVQALSTTVITPITGLIAALPSQLAAALRKYDEEEAVRLAAAAEETHLERQIERCMTCTEIGRLDAFDYDATMNRIFCLDCQRYGYKAPGKHTHGMRSWGDYDGPHPAEPLRGIKAREFKTVKHAVLRHARSPLHAWCEVHAIEAAAETRKTQSAGMICGRLVLQIVKEHDSERSYERRIAAQHAMGSDVGNKNHSWAFYRGLKKAMHTVITDTIQTVLITIDPTTLRAPAFAAVADKATVDRRTGQMHGTIVMIRGRMVALFLSVLIVKADGGGGDGLAQLQVDTYTRGKPLTLTTEMMRAQLTGQGYDGQYQGAEQRSFTGLSVPVHLAEKLGLNPVWVLSRWDPAHRIERLGMGDVRKSNSPKVKFYIELAGKVAEAQTGFLHGKGFERVTVAWGKLKLRMGSIGSVCTTCFCASERKVYKAFFRNLPIFIADMVAARADSNELNNIRSVTFVVHICGTIDLLRPLKDLSLTLQAVSNLPWELDVLITVFISSMERLEQDLRDKNMLRELSTRDALGKPIRAFECLSTHSPKVKQLKLELTGSDGSVVQQVDLVKSTDRRSSRGVGNFRNTADEYDAAIINLADFAREIIDKINARLANTPREERWIRRMAAALDLRALAFPTGDVATGLATAATSAADNIVSITAFGLTSGTQIQVLVSEAGEPEVWWRANLGGPATGAGGHGVIIVYDVWVQQGHPNTTISRACFNSDGLTLLDVDEMATWRWRRPTAPLAPGLPVALPPAAPPPAAPAAVRSPEQGTNKVSALAHRQRSMGVPCRISRG